MNRVNNDGGNWLRESCGVVGLQVREMKFFYSIAVGNLRFRRRQYRMSVIFLNDFSMESRYLFEYKSSEAFWTIFPHPISLILSF